MYQSWQPRVRLGLESRNWPTVPATVKNTYVDFQGSLADKNERANFVPVIGYEFSVEGMSYYSNVRAASGIGFASREDAEAFLADYPEEGLLSYYNPENPNESVLEPGIPFAYRLLVVLPIALVLVGALVLWTGIRFLVTGKA